MCVGHASRVTRQNGSTALMKAAIKGYANVVQQLLERGANVDHVDKVSAASGSFAKHLGGIVYLDTA